MKIETKNIKDIVLFDNNCRVPNTEILRKSIQEFGFIQPILINQDNLLICGYMRIIVAQELGIMEIPCLIVDWDQEKCRKFRLVDNKVAEKSNWEWCNLDKELHAFPDLLKEYTFVMDEFSQYPDIGQKFKIVKQENLF